MNTKAKKAIFTAGVNLTIIMGVVLISYGVYNLINTIEMAYNYNYNLSIYSIITTAAPIIAGVLDILAYNKLLPLTKLEHQETTTRINDMEGFSWAIVSLVCAFPVGILTFLPYASITEYN